MSLLRIIIPAHNEEKRILPTLEAYCGYFGGRATVSVVLNGCTDRTADIVRGAMTRFANLTCLDIPAAVGKGGAVRCGFVLGDEPYIGFVDADLSFEPMEFDKLFSRCIEANLDCAIGSRWEEGSEELGARSTSRAIASRIFRVVRTVLFGLRFRDTQCGIKVFRRAAVDKILDDLELANFAFDVDMLVQLARSNARIEEVPVQWRDTEGTTIKLRRTAISMLVSLMRLRIRRSFLGNLPYTDMIARQSVMPVVRRISLLVLRDRLTDVSADREVEGLVARWREEGIEVREWPKQSHRARQRLLPVWLRRLQLFLWYIFGTPRAFDAIVEVRERTPWFLPLISVKPRLVLFAGSAVTGNRVWDRLYRAAQLKAMPVADLDTAYHEVNAMASMSALYSARLFLFGSGPFVVYADGENGERRKQHLVSEASPDRTLAV